MAKGSKHSFPDAMRERPPISSCLNSRPDAKSDGDDSAVALLEVIENHKRIGQQRLCGRAPATGAVPAVMEGNHLAIRE